MGGPNPNPNPNPNSNHQIPKTTITSNPSRLKRENFQRTKHDKSFSKWKILIGPSDWEDYKANKEGAERYRVANLPSVCGPGLYEIGVAVCATGSGRDVDKLGSGSESIVVVYLGQADNVKSRLQHYGRSGSHLVNGFGLFKDVFSRGFPIVYRWAPMSSKSEAERTEAKLLERFDYAWNKVGNDARRPNDVLNKIEKISSQNTNVPKIVKMLQSLREQKVGIPIKAEKLPSFEKKPNYDIYSENVSFFDRIFKFSRSQPRLVPHFDSEVLIEKMENAHVCGVLLSDGSVCNDPPVKGRKRCAKHKGRRLTSVSNKTSVAFPSINRSDMDVKDNFPSICGVILLDGSPCAKPPFIGRKRCEEHKGMRVNHIMSKSLNLKLVTEKHHSNLDLVDYCGVNLGDGKFCDRQPVKGRKRCEQHKGKRVNAFASNLLPKNQWPNAGHNSVHALPIPDVSHT